MIRIDNLSITYRGDGREITAIRDFSMDLPGGEHLHLFGPNGSGKSSICRVIAGVRLPVQGRVIVDGVTAGGDGAELRRRVAYVPDRLFWPPTITVGELVARSRLDERLDRGALDCAHRLLADLDPSARPPELSRGGERRLALAILGSRPAPVIVLDEPFVGIDAEVRDAALAFVEAISLNRTMVLSSHDTAAAAAVTGSRLPLKMPANAS